jgi:hypothetical protein
VSALVVERIADTELAVRDGAVELGRYAWGGPWQHPHWHPLRAPRSGAVLTCRAPFDHPWHCGLWWSWKQIGDAMCWNPPLHGESASAEARVESTTIDGAAIVQQVVWRASSGGEALLSERRSMRVAALAPDAWCIDWDIACASAVERTLSATPWPDPPWGGYGGLAARPARSLAFDEEVRVRGVDGGLHRGDGCHGQPGRWLAYSGALDGVALPRAPRPAPRGTIALVAHPLNPFPGERWWATGTANAHARFFCLGTGFLMDGPARIGPDRPLRFRYRCVLADGSPDAEALDAWSG